MRPGGGTSPTIDKRRHRLARTGFADDPDRLALPDLERNAVDRADDAARREEMRLEIGDRQQRRDRREAPR